MFLTVQDPLPSAQKVISHHPDSELYHVKPLSASDLKNASAGPCNNNEARLLDKATNRKTIYAK